jgi:hypothetical protein
MIIHYFINFMVLLCVRIKWMHIYSKKFISDASCFFYCTNQVKMVKLCQQLGVDLGGFYRPGYRDGAKLSLQMMCLGMNWDPDSSSYGYTRPFDGAQPPNLPEEFRNFIQDAIKSFP